MTEPSRAATESMAVAGQEQPPSHQSRFFPQHKEEFVMSVSRGNRPRRVWADRNGRTRGASLARLGMMAACLALGAGALAQTRTVPDTYTAVTTNMTPSGVTLKADILHWSDQAGREAVVEALGADDPSAALTALPTVGVVWRSGSAVGSAIKYAYRAMAPDGAEQVVLVTDKPVGSTSFNAWKAESGPAEPRDYSVIQLSRPMSGKGSGSMSLAADVVVDAVAAFVSLQPNAPKVLADVALEPKPYWAHDPDKSAGTDAGR
jgi:hypothetical protein